MIFNFKETTFEDAGNYYTVEIELSEESQWNTFEKIYKGWFGYKQFNTLPRIGEKIIIDDRSMDAEKAPFSPPIAIFTFDKPCIVKDIIHTSWIEAEKRKWKSDKKVCQQRVKIIVDIPESTNVKELKNGNSITLKKN